MFERFTEDARRALFFARYDASILGGRSIETEHLLLGVLREPRGLVVRLFARLNGSVETLREEAAAGGSGEKTAASVEIPFSDETKRALIGAAEDADRLEHSHIGPEHLLLGLLRDPSTRAGGILVARGLRLDEVREELVKPPGGPGEPSPPITPAEKARAIDEIRQLVAHLAQIAIGVEGSRIGVMALTLQIDRVLNLLKPEAGP